MTAREAVKAAIRHKACKRIPYAIDFTGEATALLQKEVGCDDVGKWIDNDVQDIGVPWWDWHNLGPDWAGPDTPKSPATVIGCGSYDKLEDNIKAARDASDKYFLVRLYGSHFEKAYFSRGIENLLCDMAADYDFAKKLHNKVIEKNMVMLENFLHIAEIDGVLLGSDWGAQRGLLMSPEIWTDMIRPGEQREYDLIKASGKDVWIHSCGCVEAIIPDLIEMGVDVLNPLQPECMDIYRIKEAFGDRIAFWGGISTQRTLPYGTPDEVREETRRVVRAMSRGGGYIAAPSQGIQEDVPESNLVALLEELKRFG